MVNHTIFQHRKSGGKRNRTRRPLLLQRRFFFAHRSPVVVYAPPVRTKGEYFEGVPAHLVGEIGEGVADGVGREDTVGAAKEREQLLLLPGSQAAEAEGPAVRESPTDGLALSPVAYLAEGGGEAGAVNVTGLDQLHALLVI